MRAEREASIMPHIERVVERWQGAGRSGLSSDEDRVGDSEEEEAVRWEKRESASKTADGGQWWSQARQTGGRQKRARREIKRALAWRLQRAYVGAFGGV